MRVAHLMAFVKDRLLDTQGRLDAWVAEEAMRQMQGGGDPRLSSWKGVRRATPREFEEILGTLLTEIRRDGAEPVLISMPRTLAKETAFPVLVDYTRAVEDIARERVVDLVDVRGLFRDATRAGHSESELFVDGDPVHPSPTGHRLIAESLLPVVREHLPR